MLGKYRGIDPTAWVYQILEGHIRAPIVHESFETMPQEVVHIQVFSFVDSPQVGEMLGAKVGVNFTTFSDTDEGAYTLAVEVLERLREAVDNEYTVDDIAAGDYQIIAMPRQMDHTTLAERRNMFQHIFSVQFFFYYA